jgi:general secretion pathway protein A
VDRKTVDKAAAEVFDKPAVAPAPWQRTAAAWGLGLVAGAALIAIANRALLQSPSAPAASVAAKSAGANAKPAAVSAADVKRVSTSATTPATLLHEPGEAWRELARAWKAEVGAEADPCRALQQQQLQCFSKNLSLAVIRELGRPGVVTLDAASGSPSYAVLTSLTRDTATLRAGGSEHTVALSALAARWQGEFATLWKAPPGYAPRSSGAQTPETIAWVANRLATVNGTPPPTDARTLDAPLRSQLRAFQLAQGLTADGQPGPMTFMQLNRAAGVDEPRLRTEP